MHTFLLSEGIFMRPSCHLLVLGIALLAPVYNVSAQEGGDVDDRRSYQQKVEDKALNGLGNIGAGMLEIPKSIIQTTNESNVIYGFVGGMFKGMVHTAGRVGTGLADLLTAPLPTKPITHPLNVWDDFDTETTYGDTFRVDNTRRTPTPVVDATPPRPVVPVVAPASVNDRAQRYNQQTNRKLDRLFHKEMMK